MNDGIILNNSIVDVNGNDVTEMRENLIKTQLENAVDKYAQELDVQSAKIRESGEKLKFADGLEIMPMGNYVLILPYDANIFDPMRKTATGILFGNDGRPTMHKSQETGEMEPDYDFVKTGVVVETGPECKFVENGDVVYFTKASEFPVPFYQQGFVTVNENRVVAIVNEKLTERKNKMK